MSQSNGGSGRDRALAAAGSRHPRKFTLPTDDHGNVRISGTYGRRTLDLRKLREKLPDKDYRKLKECLERNAKLEPDLAASVAHAAKEWAIENGATHFCHWFQPLTGSTAEKHDAFLQFGRDGEAIERFDGAQLVQSEPDASSFPSGGMRTTFEARGYTAWDPSSPMFIMSGRSGKTLCIPSIFVSYTGPALDEKTGLLRSMEALDTSVRALLSTIGGAEVDRVTATVGPEQEYFLVDRAFTTLRPDLLMCGRTLVGSAPPKGQQLDDHYFGTISPRVASFMSEFEHELYQLGVPVKTRHNEVAPGQYEMAPIFEDAQVAADHNQLAMEMMRRVARRHEFDVFFHEKPFAGINGTGKHLNWSLAARRADGSWENLFNPTDAPEDNLRFLLLTGAVLRAIQRHAGALRAGISGSGNDHRLGANEAPPAIISVFLGQTLFAIFDRLSEGAPGEGASAADAISMGVAHLPDIQKDNTDRNRTSPFAFTGNKWEFRACGGSMAISFPITVLNAAVADAVTDMNTELHDAIDSGTSREQAILALLQSLAKETTSIRFEGNNYSDEWVAEAEARGLPNLRKTPEALAHLADPENHAFLVKQGVFSKDEVRSRVHVRVERYLMDLDIEHNTMLEMVDNAVLPAASAYLGELATSVAATKQAGLPAAHLGRAEYLSGLMSQLCDAREALCSVKADVDAEQDDDVRAARYAYELMPALDTLRSAADAIEAICSDSLWTLPRYAEMLFVR